MCRVGGPRCNGPALKRMSGATQNLAYAQAHHDEVMSNPESTDKQKARAEARLSKAMIRMSSADENFSKTTARQRMLEERGEGIRKELKREDLSKSQRTSLQQELNNISREINYTERKRLYFRKLAREDRVEVNTPDGISGDMSRAQAIYIASAYLANKNGEKYSTALNGMRVQTNEAGLNRYGTTPQELERDGEAKLERLRRAEEQLSASEALGHTDRGLKREVSVLRREVNQLYGGADIIRQVEDGRLKMADINKASGYAVFTVAPVNDEGFRHGNDGVRLNPSNRNGGKKDVHIPRKGGWEVSDSKEHKVAQSQISMNIHGQHIEAEYTIGVVKREREDAPGKFEYAVTEKIKGKTFVRKSSNDGNVFTYGEVRENVGSKENNFQGSRVSDTFRSVKEARAYMGKRRAELEWRPMADPDEDSKAFEKNASKSLAGFASSAAAKSVFRRLNSGKSAGIHPMGTWGGED